MRIAWRVATHNWTIASVRIRFFLPFMALKKVCKQNVYLTNQVMDLESHFDFLIFVKVSAELDLEYARHFKSKGSKIIYDLCDNMFFLESYYAQRSNFTAAKKCSVDNEKMREILSLSDWVTVPTADLRDALIEQGIDAEKIKIIKDILDPSMDHGNKYIFRIRHALHYVFSNGFRFGLVSFFILGLSLLIKFFKAALLLSWKISCKLDWLAGDPLRSRLLKIVGIQTRLQKPSTPRLPDSPEKYISGKRYKIIWFGNSGRVDLFGITDLLQLRKQLEELNMEVPIELTVVSNNREAYTKYIKPFDLPTKYSEWSLSGCNSLIQASDVAILPNSPNTFSKCKSANRTLLALLNKCPVVASQNRSLDDFRNVVLTENWGHNLKAYFENEALREKHIREAQAIIADKYSLKNLEDDWRNLLGLRDRNQV